MLTAGNSAVIQSHSQASGLNSLNCQVQVMPFMRQVVACVHSSDSVWSDKRERRQTTAFLSDQRGEGGGQDSFSVAPRNTTSVLQLRHFIQVCSQHFGSFDVVTPVELFILRVGAVIG